MPSRRTGYAAAALAIFGLELVIALGVRDTIVRPYGGDSLAVLLVYLALRAAFRIRVLAATALALLIAILVEIAQWVDLLGALGLHGNTIARVVLGTGFDPIDFVAYGIGAVAILAGEGIRRTFRSEAPATSNQG